MGGGRPLSCVSILSIPLPRVNTSIPTQMMILRHSESEERGKVQGRQLQYSRLAHNALPYMGI